MIENVEDFDVLTTQQEKQTRLNTCSECDNNHATEFGRICNACACPINYVITYKFKMCPIGKWSDVQQS